MFILELTSIIEKGQEKEIKFKFLECGRGFMVYFCQMYTSFVLYLKGIYLTLDSWRTKIDVEGRKESIRKIPEEEGMREIELEEGLVRNFAVLLA